MADVAADARRKAVGKTTSVISPLALEAVQRIDALFALLAAIRQFGCALVTLHGPAEVDAFVTA